MHPFPSSLCDHRQLLSRRVQCVLEWREWKLLAHRREWSLILSKRECSCHSLQEESIKAKAKQLIESLVHVVEGPAFTVSLDR